MKYSTNKILIILAIIVLLILAFSLGKSQRDSYIVGEENVHPVDDGQKVSNQNPTGEKDQVSTIQKIPKKVFVVGEKYARQFSPIEQYDEGNFVRYCGNGRFVTYDNPCTNSDNPTILVIRPGNDFQIQLINESKKEAMMELNKKYGVTIRSERGNNQFWLVAPVGNTPYEFAELYSSTNLFSYITTGMSETVVQ